MAKSKQTGTENEVTAYIQKLDAPLAALVEAIRQVILNTDKEVGEQVKWNSPSFFYTGEMQAFNPKEYKRDIVVLNLHKGFPLLVFPSGAKVTDTTGLLEGTYKDGRRLAKIESIKDLELKKEALQKVIRDWLKLVDK